MRANSDRSANLVFDRFAAAYASGRPDFAEAVVDTVVKRAGWSVGDQVLEVGAATGQLTVPLARHGLAITAIEPGPSLARTLRTRTAEPSVSVVNTTFEAFRPGRRYDGIVAANSFHWIDPDVAYHHAAHLLNEGSPLALLWNYPVAADDSVQQLLNERAWSEPLTDLRRDLASEQSSLDDVLEQGRTEMADSHRFTEPAWSLTTLRETWTIARLQAFAASLASTVDYFDLIGKRLRTLQLDEPVKITNRVYLSVAKQLPRSDTTGLRTPRH